MDNQFTISAITNLDELMDYISEWREILRENNNDIIFIDPDWVIRSWTAFKQNQELFVLLIKKDDMTIGLCPLMIETKRLYKEVQFIGSPQSTYMDFVIRQEYTEQVIELLAEYLLEMKDNIIVSLAGMSENSDNYILLARYLAEKKVPSLQTSAVAPFIRTEGKDFELYYKTRFSPHIQKNFKRGKRRLSEIGTLVYKEIDHKDIDEIFRIHNQRWEKKLDTSGFSNKESMAFFSGLIDEEGISFKAVIRTLSLNSHIIAFQYCLQYNGRQILLRSAHDDLFSIYAPGRMLKKESIRECFQDGIKFCDFGIGYEPYKFEWTDERRNIMTVIFSKKNIVSKLIFVIFFVKGKARSMLKQHRFFVIFKRNTLGKVKYFFSSNHIKEIIDCIRINGAFSLLSKMLKNMMKQVFRIQTLVLFEKGVRSLVHDDGKPQYDIRIASIDDLYPLAEMMNCPPKSVMKRFYQTHKCFVAYSAGKIVHYSWVSFADSGGVLDSNVFKPQSESVCIYESFTDMPSTNTFASYDVLLQIQKYLLINKQSKAYLIIGKKDTDVKSAAEKLGFRPDRGIKTVRLLGKTIITNINNLHKEVR